MKIISFFKAIRGEFNHIVWPTRNHIAVYTVLVIAVTIAIAYYMGLFDLIFTEGLSWLVAR